MAKSIYSWISQIVPKHNQLYGPDLERTWTGSWLCQIVHFTTYRTPECADAEISGVISDCVHRVPVRFDSAATTRFETSVAGELPETLTSCLRAVLKINAFRVELTSPRAVDAKHPLSLVPRVRLYILSWDVISGDRHDPELYPHTHEIGEGRKEGETRAILKNWWIPSPHSAPTASQRAALESPMPPPQVARPSRPRSVRESTSASSVMGGNANDPPIPLATFLAPFLDPAAKRQKGIPEWIFDDPPPAQQQELDAITFFGLDTNIEDNEDPNPKTSSSRHHTPVKAETALEDAQDDIPITSPSQVFVSPLPPHPPRRDSPITSPPHSSPNVQTKPYVPHTSSSPPARPVRSNEEEEDEDIPVRPRPIPTQRRAPVFRKRSPEPRPRPNERRDGSHETDEGDLSDYERQLRRIKKVKQDKQTERKSSSQAQPGSQPADDVGDTSLSQSQDSTSFGLARYATPSQGFSHAPSQRIAPVDEDPAEAIEAVEHDQSGPGELVESQESSGRRRAEVLVSTTDESCQRTEPDSPVVPAAAEAEQTPQVTQPSRKRPRTSTATNVSADADDEGSLPNPSKQTRPAKLARHSTPREAHATSQSEREHARSTPPVEGGSILRRVGNWLFGGGDEPQEREEEEEEEAEGAGDESPRTQLRAPSTATPKRTPRRSHDAEMEPIPVVTKVEPTTPAGPMAATSTAAARTQRTPAVKDEFTSTPHVKTEVTRTPAVPPETTRPVKDESSRTPILRPAHGRPTQADAVAPHDRPKLGGWYPNLSVDGLKSRFVVKAADGARQDRAQREARRMPKTEPR